MINTKMRATVLTTGQIAVLGYVGEGHEETVAVFEHDAHFYLLTGFRRVKDFNEAQEEKPQSFLVWKRSH